MTILITLIVVIALGAVLIQTVNYDILGGLLALTGGVLLFIALIGLVISPLSIKAGIEKYETTRQTIERARENGNSLEQAALQHKIIECNQWLAGHIYWNDSLFDIWIPDEVTQLELLR